MIVDLTDKVALVTGASRGIGKAIALELANSGAFVIGTATSPEGAQNITRLFAPGHGEGKILDVNNKGNIENLLTELADSNRLPAILVNNAGITADNLVLRMSDEEWEKVISTNLNGLFYLCRACLKPMFRARWGRIINISSVVGASGNAGQANYSAAKAGIAGFSKSLAQEIASRKITVNVVSPGFIDTDMTASLPTSVKEAILQKVPVKRLGTPEDIAHIVAFLSSNLADYITGENIHVNGGMYMN